MKFLYTRHELDEAIHNALVERDKQQYMEDQYRRIEKEIRRLKDTVGELESRLFNAEMFMRRHECNCKAPKNDELDSKTCDG